jgi:polysaccharide export outer membrane protein
MPKRSIPLILSTCILALFFVSCRSAEKTVYFQKSSSDSLVVSSPGFTPVFKVDDFLSVVITAEDPEAAQIYNLPPVTNSNQGYAVGNSAPYGYLVNANGEISLPVLGKIKVAGKSRMQLEDEIKVMLDGQLKNPTVQIQILNFKITVLGDVKAPGTFKIPNERITLLEAIGLSGDLKMSGERENVMVIRDSCGVKKEYRVNLTTNEVFSSPVYYLQQNDVVYVQPNAAARSEGTFWRATGPILISVSSLVVTTIAIITR